MTDNTDFDFTIGRKLPNGAVLVAHHRVSKDRFIVMGAWKNPGTVEYAVWDADQRGECYWGRYSRGISTAAQRYAARIAERERNAP
jgi:hypothetical protein